jgi:hypothetical protein
MQPTGGLTKGEVLKADKTFSTRDDSKRNAEPIIEGRMCTNRRWLRGLEHKKVSWIEIPWSTKSCWCLRPDYTHIERGDCIELNSLGECCSWRIIFRQSNSSRERQRDLRADLG